MTMDPYEEEVVEERPVVRRRRYYGPVGDPLGGIVSLIVVLFIIWLILELLGVVHLTNAF